MIEDNSLYSKSGSDKRAETSQTPKIEKGESEAVKLLNRALAAAIEVARTLRDPLIRRETTLPDEMARRLLLGHALFRLEEAAYLLRQIDTSTSYVLAHTISHILDQHENNRDRILRLLAD